ncbi:hypothetical protein [Geodermatophilus sp. CPCC 205761]|uniref:arsenate reductase/protein-tyrosine-phosphatase family protein n=1 Tax=Geodermatophilus sp. CPCC 205761 TaxID=2936597 RepID=UPI003EEFC810
MRLLFVCTGNECRSPVAESLARAWARDALGADPGSADVHVSSAGLSATAGRPMDAHSATVLASYGVRPGDFRARAFTPELADAADLVLTMTRAQRREVLGSTPRGLRRTFTLREAADLLLRADLAGMSRLPPDARVHDLCRRLDAARAGRGASDADDIADPVGRAASVHRDVVDAIATALRPLADVLFTGLRREAPS